MLAKDWRGMELQKDSIYFYEAVEDDDEESEMAQTEVMKMVPDAQRHRDGLFCRIKHVSYMAEDLVNRSTRIDNEDMFDTLQNQTSLVSGGLGWTTDGKLEPSVSECNYPK